jgi:hypothetical protein
MALNTRFPAGMTTPAQFVYNDERRSVGTIQDGGVFFAGFLTMKLTIFLRDPFDCAQDRLRVLCGK